MPKTMSEVLSDFHGVEYIGKIDGDTYFVIYRPEQGDNYDNCRVLIGPRNALKEVEVSGGQRYHNKKHPDDDNTVVINTVAGTLWLPPKCRKDKQPLFNDKLVELF